MIKPVKYDCSMNQGATFELQYRIKELGAYINPLDDGGIVRFTASDKAGGTHVFEFSSADSPVQITVDGQSKNLVTIRIEADDTDIANPSLYYEVDHLLSDSTVQRRLFGNINVLRSA